MSKPRRQDAGFGISKSRPSHSGLSPIPIEWLDPDCWRLPSGKALAEFALQAGFLAPLMLGMPRPRRLQSTGVAQPGQAAIEAKPETGERAAVNENRADAERKLARESSRSTKRV